MEGKPCPDVCRRKMTVYYAGPVAQALFFYDSPIKVLGEQVDDQENVRKCMDDLKSLGVIEPDVGKYRLEAWDEANRLVEERRSGICAIAQDAYQRKHSPDQKLRTLHGASTRTYFIMDD
jgi:hypothetical protein